MLSTFNNSASDESKRIAAFISIPKNASTSILKMLELGEKRDFEDTDCLVICENHQRGAVLKKKYDFEELFVFCFSRNPYDRCVSWYQWHLPITPYSTMTFDQWVKSGLPHHWEIQNETNYLEEGISPLLQYSFVENCKIDFIGRIENFDYDINTVIRKLNIICLNNQLQKRFILNRNVPNENVSERKAGLDDYYSAETKEIVYQLLQKDFEYFGYKK